jgi:tRNA 2-thiouridine synthesizing protein A
MAEYDHELDASGLNCPLPILRARKSLGEMKPEETLLILATDPGSVKDFEAFAKQTNNLLLSSTESDGTFKFVMQKT